MKSTKHTFLFPVAGVQMIAALMEDSAGGDKLLDATRKLCSAFSDLLTAAEPETKEVRNPYLNALSLTLRIKDHFIIKPTTVLKY